MKLFDLSGRIAVITGGAGFLGRQHAKALMSAGALPILVNPSNSQPQRAALELFEDMKSPCWGFEADITQEDQVERCLHWVHKNFGQCNILINNAANNPAVKSDGEQTGRFDRLESFSLETWNADIAVGLTGAFLMSKHFGSSMASSQGGVIVNIASELALIAPDQRLYRKDGLSEHEQPVKPVSYPTIKAGLIGLTRYLATYWADKGVRVNALCPGGMENGQPGEFKEKIGKLIPMGRMARKDEYQGAILFLCSDASSYMTGATLSVDGGRTCW
jgi:NAD(P)-dependent dehydrogenase (short-subunit alcohol dehydrogenase family)